MNSIIFLVFFGSLSALNDYATANSKCAAAISAYPPGPETGCCGVEAAETKILGGNRTEIDQFPWLAQIEYLKEDKLKVICGATLIGGKFLLTAAHCVSGPIIKTFIPKNIILGEYDTSHEGPDCVPALGGGEDCTDGAIRIPIEKIIIHPQYEDNSKLRRNDIALIKMTELAPFTDFIRPICLPTSDITLTKDPIKWLKFSAWGTASGPSPVKLHVGLPFVPQEKCQLAYSSNGRNITLWKGQLCAGGEKDKDSCKGDGGLPLMNDNGGRYEVVGLVSFGSTPCGTENIPSVFTNVYEYNYWIMSSASAAEQT
ncbi:unnamed protein product [Arctia plantaginis]|uniref:Peptidase S1 domain-containing protein n=1 Tax=Arctia plantaginis TaxID=874455 RepID=A0A8S1ACU5_ARCPL|nr:unnamed protein product [Arctia plantaginis]